MSEVKPGKALPQATGGRVVALPVLGEDHSELMGLVRRLKGSDPLLRSPNRPTLAPEAVEWAQEWQLPMQVFEYFTLDAEPAERRKAG